MIQDWEGMVIVGSGYPVWNLTLENDTDVSDYLSLLSTMHYKNSWELKKRDTFVYVLLCHAQISISNLQE